LDDELHNTKIIWEIHMQRIKTIISSLICIMLIAGWGFTNKNEEDYSVLIKSFTENGSYIEYPQIEGLKDKPKQISINALLKEQVYVGAKDSLNKPFVDFSNSDYVYEFKTGVGFTNSEIASFWYSFYAYGEIDGTIQNNSRFYGVTIDMKTGKKIDLFEFMVVDERLIDSTDGSNIETDYDTITHPAYHKIKDFLMVYTTKEEKDVYHIFTPQEVINNLNDPTGETNWYIDEDKKIVFANINSSIKIPYSELAEIIYPRYLESLGEE